METTEQVTQKKRSRSFGYVFPRNGRFTARFVDLTGKRRTKAFTKEAEAERWLARRQVEREQAIVYRPGKRVPFAALETKLLEHYDRKGKKSGARAGYAFKHINAALNPKGMAFADAITSDDLERYMRQRAERDGASRGTISYEIRLLKRAFGIAKVPNPPTVELPAEENTRQGFLTRDQFDMIARELPGYLCGLFTFAFKSGWRVKSELLPLRWAQVDWQTGIVRLERDTTKSGEPRSYPFGDDPELLALMETQRATTREVSANRESVIPFVFHHNGNPIHDYYEAWRGACQRAGIFWTVTDRKTGVTKQVWPIPHDLRRSAAKGFIDSGVDQHTVMELCGWRSPAMFRRYHVVDEAAKRAAVSKRVQSEGLERQPTILPLRQRA